MGCEKTYLLICSTRDGHCMPWYQEKKDLPSLWFIWKLFRMFCLCCIKFQFLTLFHDGYGMFHDGYGMFMKLIFWLWTVLVTGNITEKKILVKMFICWNIWEVFSTSALILSICKLGVSTGTSRTDRWVIYKLGKILNAKEWNEMIFLVWWYVVLI
jgi:hypothetical protein